MIFFKSSKTYSRFLSVLIFTAIFTVNCSGGGGGSTGGTPGGETPVADITPPAAPSAPDLQAVDDLGASNTDNLTSLTTGLTFTGTAEADSIVELFIDGIASGITATATGGNYSIDLDLSAGSTYAISARATDASGNTSAASTALNVTVDVTPPAVYTPGTLGAVDPTLDALSDSGSSNSDGITNITTSLQFTGNLGSSNAGGLIQLYIGGTLAGTAVADGTGAYTLTTSSTVPVNPGSVTFIILSPSGIPSSSYSTSVVVDTTAPSFSPIGTTAPKLAATSDAGISNTDGLTNTSTNLDFAGNLGASNAGNSVEVTVGTVSVGTATVLGDGSFTLNSGANDIGTGGAVSFAITDPAGNVSSTQTGGTIVVETSRPTITAFSANPSSGTFGFGTNIDITVTFSEPVTLSGGNLQLSLNTTPVQMVSITAINNSDTATGTYTVQLGDAAGPLNVSLAALSAGSLIDAAGNTADLTSIPSILTTITIDTAAPVLTSISSGTPDGRYGTGSSIGITLTFDTNVNLSSTGNLTLALQGGGVVTITGPVVNSPTLSGTYIVGAGENANPLTAAPSGVSLNGGATLQSGTGTNAITNIPSNNFSANNIIVDTLPPVLNTVNIASSNSVNSLAKTGDIITLAFTANENLAATPTVTMFGNSATVTQGANAAIWSASYTIAGSELEGAAPFIINFSDTALNAANAGSPVTSVTDSSSVTYDKTVPEIVSSTLDSGNAFIDLSYSEGVFSTGTAPLSAADLTFASSCASCTVIVSSVKKNDSTISATATALSGGESNIRVFLTVVGTPTAADTIQLTNATVYDNAGNVAPTTGTGSSTGVINLNSAPTVSFLAATSSQAEGSTNNVINIPVTVSPVLASGKSITINFTKSGTGANPATLGGVDALMGSSLNINGDGVTASFNIPITITGDNIDEYNEEFTITLVSGTGYMIGAISAHSHTITNDDSSPNVEFTSASQASVDETNNSIMTVTAQLKNATSGLVTTSGKNVSIPFNIMGTSTAELNTDYSIDPSPLIIPAGSSSANIAIKIIGDSINENNETIDLQMGTPANASLGTQLTHTASITDDDPMPTVSINNVSFNEGIAGTTNFTFTVTLNTASGRSTSVNYATADGTATTANNDYQSAFGTLDFSAGQVSQTVTILVNGDITNEPDETFKVNLSGFNNINPTGSTLQGTGTILNDDTATPSISFAATSSGSFESVTNPVITINLSPAPSVDTTIHYSVAGSGIHTATGGGTDFNDPGAGSVLVTSGSGTFSIPLMISNDSIDEFDETLTLTLSTGTGYNLGSQTTHTYTILDDDPQPQIYFTQSSSATANESTALNIAVQLSAPSGINVTVDVNDDTLSGVAYATATTDYSLTRTSGIQLTIPAGNTSANVVLTPVNDAIDETNGGTQAGEMVILGLTNPGYATLGNSTTHTSMITDDDGQPNFSVADISVSEATASATVTISCVAFSCTGYSVNYATANGTAVSGSDFTTTSGTASVWTGSAPNWSKTVTIPIVNDSLAEPNETILFNLSGNTAGSIISRSTAIVTINNDDTSLTIASAETLDCGTTGAGGIGGSNGKIDTYKITFSEAVTDSTFNGYAQNSIGAITSTWTVIGYNNPRLLNGTALESQCGIDIADDNIIFIRFDEATAADTGVIPDLKASASSLSATSGHGRLYYDTGNVVTADVAETDLAGPYIWKAVAADVGSSNNSNKPAAGDTLTVYYSEGTNAPTTLTTTGLDNIIGLGSGTFGVGNVTSAVWSTTTNTNDTLTIVFANTSSTVTDTSTIWAKGIDVTDASANVPGSVQLNSPSIIGAFDAGYKGPVVASAEYLDTDTNGRIDHVKVTFDMAVNDSTINGYVDTNTIGSSNNIWQVAGYNNVRIDPTYSADTDNDNIVYFIFDEGLDYDTGSKPDITATASGIKSLTGGCYIKETVAQCLTTGVNENGNILSTDVNELDAARPVFVSVTARVNDRYIFVKFSENVWGSPNKPSCGAGGELVNDSASSSFDFAYVNSGAGGATKVESVDGTDNCASSDAFVRLFTDATFLSTDISADKLTPYDSASIYDAANNAMSAAHFLTIQQTVAPYVVSASSFYDDGTFYGAANTGYWFRVVFSEPMSYVGAVTASNYTISISQPGTCTTLSNAIPAAVRAISTSVFDLKSVDAQCADTTYGISANRNILDINEIEPVGSPNIATTVGTANPDKTKPKLLQAISIDSQTVQITYSEPMDSASALLNTNYTITPDLNTTGSMAYTITATSDPSVFIISHPDVQTGTFYTVTANSANVLDVAANVINSVPGNQATFRGQGSPIQYIQDGPLFSNPFADGTSFSYAFGYNSKIYLGPNDTDSGAFRFEPDGANPLAVSFWDTLDLLSYFHNATLGYITANPNADAISFFQSVTTTDQGDLAVKDFLFLVPILNPKINNIFFTTDIDGQLDFYACGLSTSNGMIGGESVAATDNNVFLGITANGSKRPVLRSYSLNMTTKACTVVTAANTWNNETQNISAIGSGGGNTASIVGIDSIFVDKTTSLIYIANNGGLAAATYNDTTGKPNLASDFTAIINDTGTICTTTNVPTDWCIGGNRTLALNATDKIPAGRKGIPYIIKYNDGTNVALLMARNVTSSFTGTVRAGGELWKCSTPSITDCTNKANWTRLFSSTSSPVGSGTGIETTNNIAISMLVVNNKTLYIGFDNIADGARVYTTSVIPSGPASFIEFGRVTATAGTSSDCTNHSGDHGSIGGFCYGYQILSSTSMSKQGYFYLYLTTGCKEQATDGSICDTTNTLGYGTADGTFTAPAIRVLTQRD